MSVNRYTITNLSDYSNPKVVKKLLYSLDKLYHAAMWKGDGDSLAIYVDLKSAMHAKGVLTEKQMVYLKMWLDGYTQAEIGAKYKVGRDNISYRIDNAVKNMSLFLGN